MNPVAKREPTREDVVACWVGLVEGRVRRDQAHAWAARWVEAEEAHIRDPLVRSALLRLHGFDMICVNAQGNVMRHGGQGEFVYSITEIASALEQWRQDCAVFDSDPAGFPEREREAARAYRRHQGEV
ncbi:hypothetical protein [Streptomyces buecherae]|uniref:Uncharacterized protein n=1 Tax=Streptomyces buecherae TaxID=2763006 RepID=A0A7H8NFG8_9ACTN|nr:hypothetical protein [Streptomyces buecherae]QKW53171.1 hypothetical protein HUT08_30620 [Streptomyces buecherae]